MNVNILAVLLAAFSGFLLGGLRYFPTLFLKRCNAALGRTEEEDGRPAEVSGPASLSAVVAAYEFALLLNSDPVLCECRKAGLPDGLGLLTRSYGMNSQFANRAFSA